MCSVPVVDSCPLQYITRLMEWTEKQINNEHIFPMEVGMLLEGSFDICSYSTWIPYEVIM